MLSLCYIIFLQVRMSCTWHEIFLFQYSASSLYDDPWPPGSLHILSDTIQCLLQHFLSSLQGPYL